MVDLQPVRIIGIDPGTRYTGVGIIDKYGNQLKFVHSETIVTVNEKQLEEKLGIIFNCLTDLVQSYQPQMSSIERVFHSVNARSSLLLGHARGVAILAMHLLGVAVYEYAPNQIKSAVTGVGKAEKQQVAAMVQVLLNLNRSKRVREDESDEIGRAHV